MITDTYEAKSTTPRPAVSRQRKRTEKQALELLKDAGILAGRRRTLAARIRAARQPVAEARRIVEAAQRDAVPIGEGLDFSDVQEIRAKLIRRDGGLWPPQSDMLARLDWLIASGELDRDGFEQMAGVVLAMPQALPKLHRIPA